MHLCEIESLPSVKMTAGQPYRRMTASWHGRVLTLPATCGHSRKSAKEERDFFVSMAPGVPISPTVEAMRAKTVPSAVHHLLSAQTAGIDGPGLPLLPSR